MPVSISLSSGFSFQVRRGFLRRVLTIGFNLVIERLLISGRRRSHDCGGRIVSISLSSGFSFQVISSLDKPFRLIVGFNLVIERLLISGLTLRPIIAWHSCFNLVIERLLISGPTFSGLASPAKAVSISLSSGFSFQANIAVGNTTSSSLFQSRYRAASHFRFRCCYGRLQPVKVSISLSSGFSFQVRPRGAPDTLWLNARTSASLHFLRDDAC